MSAKIEPEKRACATGCGAVFLVGGEGNRRRSSLFCGRACAKAALYYAPTHKTHTLMATEAAYLAGIIDGEGSISIYGGYGKQDAHRYRVYLGVTNTDYGLLEWCHARTGVGGISVQKEASATRKKCWTWQCSAEMAVQVLIQVEPFLVIKPERARTIIDFQIRLRDPEQKVDKVWQHAAVVKIRALNGRGPGPNAR